MQSAESKPSSIDKTSTSTLTQLNTLIEESQQIYELENQKSNIIDELCNSLKIVTEFLRFSTLVTPNIFNLPVDTNILLLPNLDMTIRLSTGKTELKNLNTYTPDIITQILESVIPQILTLIKTEKSYLTDKITFLRSATKQLNQVNHLKDDITVNPPTEMETK